MNDAEQLDQLCITTIRLLSIDAVQKAKSGHLGTPMGWRRPRTACGSAFCVMTDAGLQQQRAHCARGLAARVLVASAASMTTRPQLSPGCRRRTKRAGPSTNGRLGKPATTAWKESDDARLSKNR